MSDFPRWPAYLLAVQTAFPRVNIVHEPFPPRRAGQLRHRRDPLRASSRRQHPLPQVHQGCTLLAAPGRRNAARPTAAASTTSWWSFNRST